MSAPVQPSTDQASAPDLPGLTNLRDVGGLRTADGRRTRTGRLLRSATPAYLDDAGARRLVGGEGLGVRLRVDLRGHREVAESTSAALAAVERRVLHLPVRGHAPAAGDESRPVASMTEHYLAFLEHSADVLVAVARALVEDDGTPALVHCTLGKDRTGVVVAVLLSAVGVRDDDVVADYARTEGQNDALLDVLRALPAYAERIARLPAEGLSARPEMMAAFLDGLRARYDGAAGYLRSVGADDDLLRRLSRVLVEDHPTARPA